MLAAGLGPVTFKMSRNTRVTRPKRCSAVPEIVATGERRRPSFDPTLAHVMLGAGTRLWALGLNDEREHRTSLGETYRQAGVCLITEHSCPKFWPYTGTCHAGCG